MNSVNVKHKDWSIPRQRETLIWCTGPYNGGTEPNHWVVSFESSGTVILPTAVQ
jgi:hypothetical protein